MKKIWFKIKVFFLMKIFWIVQKIRWPFIRLFGKKVRFYLFTFMAASSKRTYGVDHCTLRSMRPYDKITVVDAIYLIRKQLNMNVHPYFFKEISQREYAFHSQYCTKNNLTVRKQNNLKPIKGGKDG